MSSPADRPEFTLIPADVWAASEDVAKVRRLVEHWARDEADRVTLVGALGVGG